VRTTEASKPPVNRILPLMQGAKKKMGCTERLVPVQCPPRRVRSSSSRVGTSALGAGNIPCCRPRLPLQPQPHWRIRTEFEVGYSA
jgi:hypothetical protein